MDLPDNQISFRSLLQRLMKELIKDEEEEAVRRLAEKEAQRNEDRERAKKERETKKLEALERAKLRREQAGGEQIYFESRKIESQTTSESMKKDSAVSEISNQNDDTATTEELDNNETDPFRTYTSKSRPKVFVR